MYMAHTNKEMGLEPFPDWVGHLNLSAKIKLLNTQHSAVNTTETKQNVSRNDVSLLPIHIGVICLSWGASYI